MTTRHIAAAVILLLAGVGLGQLLFHHEPPAVVSIAADEWPEDDLEDEWEDEDTDVVDGEDADTSPERREMPADPAPVANRGVTGRDDAATASAADTPSRPALVVQNGRAYRWASPRDWRATEGQNVLEIAAPDGLTGASLSYVLGMFGQATPRDYLQMVLQNGPYEGLQILSVEDRGTEASVLPNMPWRVGYAEMQYRYRGVPVRAAALVGVIQGAGQYVATVVGWQAPASAWEQARMWLPRVAQSIVITDASWAVEMQRASLPRNIPHDYIYGSYNRAWTARGVPEARLSQMRREGTMGYEEMQSPTTGTRYEMPLDTYDATVGGYRNPDQPREILQRPADLRPR